MFFYRAANSAKDVSVLFRVEMVSSGKLCFLGKVLSFLETVCFRSTTNGRSNPLKVLDQVSNCAEIVWKGGEVRIDFFARDLNSRRVSSSISG